MTATRWMCRQGLGRGAPDRSGDIRDCSLRAAAAGVGNGAASTGGRDDG